MPIPSTPMQTDPLALARRRLMAMLSFFMLAAALALAAPAARAQVDPPDRVGRLSDHEGKVWLYDDEAGEWNEISRNQPISTGDRLSTDNDGRAEVRIGSTVLRLGPATDVEVRTLDDSRVDVRLGGGTLAVRARTREAADEVSIETTEGRFRPTAPGHYRIDRIDDRLAGTAWVGEMRFESSVGSVRIASGRRAELHQDRGLLREDWTEVERDPFSDWVARDDREDDTRTASRYVSPEMTGAEDLDRYGDWDQHTDYGPIWYPRTVVVGWAPYRYGRWTWVAPWGWTWVDDAPWGFAPSHYGRWVYHRDRWGWCPGGYVARPVYSPALVGWIGGGHVSLSFRIGGPAVGWVPLAPREVYRPIYVVSPGYWRRLNGPGAERPRGPYRPPTGPIMYANRDRPGGVTVVSSNVLKLRQPVAGAVQPLDGRQRNEIVSRSTALAAPDAPEGRRPPGHVRPAVQPGGVAVKAPVPRHAVARSDDDRRPRALPANGGNGGNGSLRDATGPHAPAGDDRHRDEVTRSTDRGNDRDTTVTTRPRRDGSEGAPQPPRAPQGARPVHPSEGGDAARPRAPRSADHGDGDRRMPVRPDRESNPPRTAPPALRDGPRGEAPASPRVAMPDGRDAGPVRPISQPPAVREVPREPVGRIAAPPVRDMPREVPQRPRDMPDRGGAADRGGPGPRNQNQ